MKDFEGNAHIGIRKQLNIMRLSYLSGKYGCEIGYIECKDGEFLWYLKDDNDELRDKIEKEFDELNE